MNYNFPIWFWAFATLIMINIAVFGLFGWDKRAARLNNRRVPEATLLLWVFMGGGAGALSGQKYFRHKTQKQPFKSQMMVIIAAQIFLITAYAVMSAMGINVGQVLNEFWWSLAGSNR
ncbi:MAG: DUF1294 domain-containing protein [Ahrensia sp.]|nr:DUF1294 domain-containing protein [Ahrensia sp.]